VIRTIVSVVVVAKFAAVAQNPPTPKFDVASIKLVNPPIGPHPVAVSINHGTARLEAATLRQIIAQAYVVQRIRVVGGPSWSDTDQYNIVAKTENTDATPKQVIQMLQVLLADRFKLTIRRETRELARYSLVVEKAGPKIQPAQADEAPSVQSGEPGHLFFRKQPLISLVNTIANMVDAPVDDLTGLTGVYSYELDLTPGPARLRSPGGDPANGLPPRPDPREMIADAVEKLGLRLESRKAPVELLVIDHVERPTEN